MTESDIYQGSSVNQRSREMPMNETQNALRLARMALDNTGHLDALVAANGPTMREVIDKALARDDDALRDAEWAKKAIVIQRETIHAVAFNWVRECYEDAERWRFVLKHSHYQGRSLHGHSTFVEAVDAAIAKDGPQGNRP